MIDVLTQVTDRELAQIGGQCQVSKREFARRSSIGGAEFFQQALVLVVDEMRRRNIERFGPEAGEFFDTADETAWLREALAE